MNKEQSLRGLLKNPEVEFNRLYNDYKNDFMAFARTFSIDDDSIADVYQEAFLSFYENLLNGKITSLTSSIKTYVFSIGKYKIYEYLRKNAKLRLVDEPIETNVSIDNLDLDESILSERQILLKKNIQKLGKQCQLILEYFYLKGMNLEDIKNYENYENTNVVKSQKSRCLRRLRQLIQKEK